MCFTRASVHRSIIQYYTCYFLKKLDILLFYLDFFDMLCYNSKKHGGSAMEEKKHEASHKYLYYENDAGGVAQK